MKKSLSLLLFTMIVALSVVAQPSRHPLRVVDTLTPLEKTTRNPILLQAEVDSLIKSYLAQQPPPEPVRAEPPVVKQETPVAVWVVLGIIIVLAGIVLAAVFRKQNKTSRQLRDLLLELRGNQLAANPATRGKDATLLSDTSGKTGHQALQKRLDAYENVKTQMMKTTGIPEEKLLVLFTAHSLPTRILSTNDPYPEQLQETAREVASATQLRHWSVAWQSAGRTTEPWIGPSLLDVLRALPSQGFEGVVVCPAGFVSDHLEVLYDLDIEARQLAEAQGLAFARTTLPNDEAHFCATLAQVIATHLEQAEKDKS